MTRLVIIQSAILSTLAIFLNWLRGAPLVPLASSPVLARACLVAAVIGVTTVVLTPLLTRLEPLARVETYLRRMLGPLSPGEIAALATFGPIGEELFFRGMLQPVLAGGLGSPAGGVALTALLFALLHTVVDRDGRTLWAWTTFALVLGLVLGLLFVATGHILPPLILHVVVNAGNLRRLGRPAARK